MFLHISPCVLFSMIYIMLLQIIVNLSTSHVFTHVIQSSPIYDLLLNVHGQQRFTSWAVNNSSSVTPIHPYA